MHSVSIILDLGNFALCPRMHLHPLSKIKKALISYSHAFILKPC